MAVKRNKTSKSVLENQDQQEVIAEVISDKGRKRLRVIAGQAFEQGLMVSVSRSERERFDYGDKVKVFASKAYRRGTAFLQVSPKAELSAA